MSDFFQIIVIPRDTEILIRSNDWLGIRVLYIHKPLHNIYLFKYLCEKLSKFINIEFFYNLHICHDGTSQNSIRFFLIVQKHFQTQKSFRFYKILIILHCATE